MTVVVITGSTRGIGYNMAREFLRRGCSVVVSGRTVGAVEQAVAALAAEFDGGRVAGTACGVGDLGQVQALWDFALLRFGQIDIWINNAGISHPPMDMERIDLAQMRAVVETNILGTIHGAAVALRGMRAQGRGAIYNLEGLGSNGRRVKGLSLYGMSKRAVSYLTDSLAEEVKGSGILVGAIQPGMVLTDMITSQYAGREEDWQRMQRIFRIIASDVKDVAPWVAQRVLANRRNGARIRYGGMLRMLGRLVSAPFKIGK
jgi:NAD(P)-dependent dehydrogenase (short-subunit alcohol dehydrogenase family)